MAEALRYRRQVQARVTAGLKEIVETLIEALVLVALVVFVFLQNWRATLIPLLAVPVSLISVFVLFPALGFSINTLSLFGLVLAIGLVVDDAIVVVEAVEHHIELGPSPREASLQAMREVSGPVIGIAVVLFVGLQLPAASSLQRTEAVSAKVEQILQKTPGTEHVTSIAGYNMVSKVSNSYSAFFYVALKKWEERTKPEEQLAAINSHINRALAALPDGVAFSFAPPAIPGVGAAGGFTFMLEDRSGKDVPFLAENLDKYLQAARKRPELSGLYTNFLPAVSAVVGGRRQG
jgi:multidrug efflux pump subunit AcrB